MYALRSKSNQAFTVIVLAMLALTLSEVHLRRYQLGREPVVTTGDAAMISPVLFKTLTFGQWAAGIDWQWIRSITDSSLVRLPRGQHPELYYRFMMATELDPAFFYIYYAGGNLLAVIRDDGMGAGTLVTRGNDFRKHELQSYPEQFRQNQWASSWQIPLLLAYIHLFELNDMRSAAIAFTEAAEIPGAPLYLQSLVHRFEKPGGEFEVGLRLINFMIDSELEPTAKERLVAKRKSLFVAQSLFHLRKLFEMYLQDNAKYRKAILLTSVEMHHFWERFLKSTNSSDRDPFGGKLSLDAGGRIITSTPHEAVFGLE